MKPSRFLFAALLLAPIPTFQAADGQKPSVIHKSSASRIWSFFKKHPPAPPVSVPFDITMKGNKAEIEFRASDRRTYPIGMRFKHRPGDSKDRDRVWKLTGSSERFKIGANGKAVLAPPEQPGISTPLRLKIFLIKNQKSELVHEEETEAVGAFSWDDISISKRVGMATLDPGYYKAEIELLRDCPELVGEDIELRVTSPKR